MEWSFTGEIIHYAVNKGALNKQLKKLTNQKIEIFGQSSVL